MAFKKMAFGKPKKPKKAKKMKMKKGEAHMPPYGIGADMKSSVNY